VLSWGNGSDIRGMRLISEKKGQPPEYDPPRVIEVRDAVREDAPAACEVIRRSISELCEADHRNDPEILKRWLANKTPEIASGRGLSSLTIRCSWQPMTTVSLAVGSITDAGEITLCACFAMLVIASCSTR
jgi:hypothetical protein